MRDLIQGFPSVRGAGHSVGVCHLPEEPGAPVHATRGRAQTQAVFTAWCWVMDYLPDPLSQLRTLYLPDFRGRSSHGRVGVGRVKVKRGHGEGGFAGFPGSPFSVSLPRCALPGAQQMAMMCQERRLGPPMPVPGSRGWIASQLLP